MPRRLSATMCYVSTISQRELRNNNAEVIRQVLDGESFIITRRGVPVARLAAFEPDTDLRCVRPAKRRTRYLSVSRVRLESGTAAEILEDSRGDR